MFIQDGKKFPTVNSVGIYGFFGEYRYLSNYHVCYVEYEGLIYPSSEAAYQAAKVLDTHDRRRFQLMQPHEAKKAGRYVNLRDDWDWVRDDVMLTVLADKFSRHSMLGDMLLRTGDLYLEETNDWNDIYWGVCRGIGENKLGKTLMAIRTALT